MGRGSKPPAPPDPMQTAQAQYMFDSQTARDLATLNRINEVTPFGTITYSTSQNGFTEPEPTRFVAAPGGGNRFPGVGMAVGNPMTNPASALGFSPGQAGGGQQENPAWTAWNQRRQQAAGGIPTYTRNVSLAPEEQQLLDRQRQGSLSLADTGLGLLGRIGETVAQPTDLTSLQDAYMARFAPALEQSRERLRTQLINSGFTPGTEPFNQAMLELNQQENDLRMAGLQNAIASETALRAIPLNEYSALMNQQQVQMPQYGAPPQVSLGSPDFQGLTAQNYAGQVQNWQAQQQQQGGLLNSLIGAGVTAATGGLGGLLGGGASAGLTGGGLGTVIPKADFTRAFF
jgi:hypothetical protein